MQRTGLLVFTPRGSKPTRSNRLRRRARELAGAVTDEVDARAARTAGVDQQRADALRPGRSPAAAGRELQRALGQVGVVLRHADGGALEAAAAVGPLGLRDRRGLGVTPPLASGLMEPLAPGLGTVVVFGLGSAGEQADRRTPRSTTATSQRDVGRPRAGRRGGVTTGRILDGCRSAIWDVRLVARWLSGAPRAPRRASPRWAWSPGPRRSPTGRRERRIEVGRGERRPGGLGEDLGRGAVQGDPPGAPSRRRDRTNRRRTACRG